MKTGTVITQQGCDFSVPVSSARDLRSNPDRSLGSFVRNHRKKKKKKKNRKNIQFHQYGCQSLKLKKSYDRMLKGIDYLQVLLFNY